MKFMTAVSALGLLLLASCSEDKDGDGFITYPPCRVMYMAAIDCRYLKMALSRIITASIRQSKEPATLSPKI